jgi:hypothetical protein
MKSGHWAVESGKEERSRRRRRYKEKTHTYIWWWLSEKELELELECMHVRPLNCVYLSLLSSAPCVS